MTPWKQLPAVLAEGEEKDIFLPPTTHSSRLAEQLLAILACLSSPCQPTKVYENTTFKQEIRSRRYCSMYVNIYQNQFGLCACILLFVVACGMHLKLFGLNRCWGCVARLEDSKILIFSLLKVPAERALPLRKVHRVSAR